MPYQRLLQSLIDAVQHLAPIMFCKYLLKEFAKFCEAQPMLSKSVLQILRRLFYSKLFAVLSTMIPLINFHIIDIKLSAQLFKGD